MRTLKAQPLATILITTALALSGCGGGDSSSPQTPDQTEEQAAESAPAEESSPAGEELVKEDATTDDKKNGGDSKGEASSVEQKVVSEWEEVMGQECTQRDVYPKGSPLEHWSYFEYPEFDDGLFGPLEGQLVQQFCERADTSERAEAPRQLALRFFETDADVGSEVDQMSWGEGEPLEAAWNQKQRWVAVPFDATASTWEMLESQGAEILLDDGGFQP